MEWYIKKVVLNVKAIKSLMFNVLLWRECFTDFVLAVTTTLKELNVY